MPDHREPAQQGIPAGSATNDRTGALPDSVRRYLDVGAGDAYSVVTHREAWRAEDIAEELGMPGRSIAKAVLVEAASRSALLILPASDRLVLSAVRDALEEVAVSLVNECEIKRRYDWCEAVLPALPGLLGVNAYADRRVFDVDFLVFGGGVPDVSIRMWRPNWEDMEMAHVSVKALC